MVKKCLSEDIIVLISKKWNLRILKSLELNGKMRFNELLNDLKFISPRTLSKRLKELEAMKLIDKKKFNQIPPKVEYSFTTKGKGLIKCFKELDQWTKKWQGNKQ